MLRRWMIRSCFMLPILLCLAGWGWSVNHQVGYFYPRPTTTYELGTSWGIAYLKANSSGPVSIPGWQYSPLPAHWLPPNQPGFHNYWGFLYRWDIFGFVILVPYWFLILLFSILLFFVWRRTRAKVEGRGFEVILKERTA